MSGQRAPRFIRDNPRVRADTMTGAAIVAALTKTCPVHDARMHSQMSDESAREVWKLDRDAPFQISLADEIRLSIHFAKQRQSASLSLAGVSALAAGLSVRSGGWIGLVLAVVLGVVA
jgi:hypothetical protein